LVVVRLPVVVRRVAPGVTGLVPAGRVASSVALGTVVVPGEYTVPGVVPTGVVPAGVVRPPLMVLLGTAPAVVPAGVVIVPFIAPPLSTAPLVVPTWPGAPAPGVMVEPGETGTVWAETVVLKPSPSRAAKANAIIFIRKVRISKKELLAGLAI
jgi:hypothetical protein